jgi:serine/threonine protein kinase
LWDLKAAELAASAALADCPSCILARGVFEIDDYSGFLMDLCLCDMANLKASLTIDEFRYLSYGILSALAEVHDRSWVHRDVKLQNMLVRGILVNGETVVWVFLADFGCATPDNGRLTGIFGTRGYIAPEVELGLPYSCKADVWSAGVSIHELLTGVVPVYDLVAQQLGRLDLTLLAEKAKGDSELVALISRLLNLDPNDRPTAKDALESDFFKDIREKMKNGAESLPMTHSDIAL